MSRGRMLAPIANLWRVLAAAMIRPKKRGQSLIRDIAFFTRRSFAGVVQDIGRSLRILFQFGGVFYDRAMEAANIESA